MNDTLLDRYNLKKESERIYRNVQMDNSNVAKPNSLRRKIISKGM